MIFSEVDIPAVWQVGDTILDLYEVTGLLGEGGMGTVYKVHHNNWNVDLAVKTPKPEIFAKAGGAENFIRECETWVHLGLHPHTVSCYYVRALGGIPRVFAEYMAGGSLHDWIRKRTLYEGGQEQALARILDVAIQFAWGLDYAHEQGLVHQDVKPANVMMTPDVTVKVTDFGLAKARAMAGEPHVPSSGQSILVSTGGMTPAYCSPEQATGQPLSRKTDIWSWGLSVLEMFVGEVTWLAGQAALEALAGYLETGPEDHSIPAMPVTLGKLLKFCFQRDPANRPSNMADVADALQKIYRREVGRTYPREAPKPAEALADSLNNRAVSLLDLGKTDDAERLWDEALKADPHHIEATYNRGVVLWRSGRVTDDVLVRQLEEVRNSHSGNQTAEYLLALVHLERQDVEAARKLLEGAKQWAHEEAEVQAVIKAANSADALQSRYLRTFEGHTGYVHSVCLSADGRWALSGSDDKTLRLWEVSTGHCLRVFEGHASYVNSVCLSADGQWALSGSDDKTLRLWEVSSGRCLRTIEGHTRSVRSVCLSADGRWALSGSDDKTLRLWEVSSGRCLRTFEGHARHVCSVCISADGQWALSGSQDCTLRLWEVSTGRCVRTFEGHSGTVNSVSLSVDGCWALTWGGLWEVSTGRCVRTFEWHVSSVNLSADGRWALSGGGNALRLWEVSTGRCLRTFEGHKYGVSCVCLSADGRWALSGGGDQTLRLWEVTCSQAEGRSACVPRLSRLWSHIEVAQTQTQARTLLRQGAEALADGRFQMALSLVAEARRLPGHERTSQTLTAWADVARLCRRVSLREGWFARAFEGHKYEVNSVCLSADGRWALSGSWDKALRLWEVSTGRCVQTFEGHTHTVNSICLSADGCWALSGSSDTTLRLWEVSTGRCLRAFKGHTRTVNSVCLSADGRWALSGGGVQHYSLGDHTLRLWEVGTGRCLRTFEGHTNVVNSVCLSADGRWALSGSQDRILRLWEVSTGRCVRTFEGHTGSVDSVCLSADGRWALSGSWDFTLRLWEVSTGRCVRTFEGHTGRVHSICLSADGRWAFSGGDTTLRLWEVSSGRCVRIFEGHTRDMTSVYLSLDGRWALSGSHDQTLRLWELDWELEAYDPVDWDEGAQPYLQTFLTLHTPYATTLPQDHQPSEEAITLALTRRGRPTWNEEDFQQLVRQLQNVGYGWLRPEGVRQQLERMARDWQGPSPLPG